MSGHDETIRQTIGRYQSTFSADRILPAPQVSASEDFGILGERGGFPSTFWFVGSTEPARFIEALEQNRVQQDIPTNHSPHFAPLQDPTLAAGVEAMVVAARQWLSPT